MFDFSWAEIVVVALVGLVVIGPSDLPKVIRFIKKTISKVKNVSREFTKSILDEGEINSLKKEAEEVNQDLKQIVDLEGNLQDTYDVSDIYDELNRPDSSNKK